jgi:hypothetical protein
LGEPHTIEGPRVRPNRDTLYSEAVFDLDAGPVEITLPGALICLRKPAIACCVLDAGDRFLSMMVIDEDHYVVTVVYRPGSYSFTREGVGTRHLFAAVRILVDPADQEDGGRVHALQDAISASQQSAGSFEVPNWDRESQKKVRDALLSLGSTLPDLRKGGGSRDEVDPVRHLIATAAGWGLNPDKDAIYLNVTPSSNDGSGVYRLTVKDVPVDGFWSIKRLRLRRPLRQERP